MVEQIKRLTLHRTIWCCENNQCTAFCVPIHTTDMAKPLRLICKELVNETRKQINKIRFINNYG